MKKTTDDTSPDVSTEKNEVVQGRKDLMRAIFFCAVIVISVRSFLFEPFKIPSSSMVPTLRIGDHIFVSKFTFGLSVPFTKIEFVRWGSPKRGDVIVFWFPRDESLHYIKRVIGIPGDRVELKGKDIIVNGVQVHRESVQDENEIEQVLGSKEFMGELFKETIEGSTHYVRYIPRTSYELSREARVEVVPPEKLFVMGDNRDDSYDSRSWGFVPRENVRGRAQMIWISLDQEQGWNGINKVRWNRAGTLIR